jgi:Calcineurin-like phosphoesterase
MFRPFRRAFARHASKSIALFLVLVGLAWVGRAQTQAESNPIVAIGDVHGAYDDFVGILQHVGLIDRQNHWAGGKATFVQVGDLIDRGPKPREVLHLMMALAPCARADEGPWKIPQ